MWLGSLPDEKVERTARQKCQAYPGRNGPGDTAPVQRSSGATRTQHHISGAGTRQGHDVNTARSTSIRPDTSARRIGPSAARTAACAAGIVFALLAGCGTGSSSHTTNVVYGVVGSACNADIVYQDLTQAQTTLTAQSLPWHFEFDIPQSQVNGFPLYLSASNNCAVGSLTANAEVNGALFATQTTFAPNGSVLISVNLF